MATVPGRFLGYQEGHPQDPCQFRRLPDGTFAPYTARQTAERIWSLAGWLRQAGVQGGDRVVVLAATRPEWVHADLAIMADGAVTVPIFPSLPADQVAYICHDSGASLAVVQDEAARAKLPAGLPALVMDDAGWAEAAGALPPTSADLAAWAADVERRVPEQSLATIVYTSGTTANSRGAMLTHGNLLGNARSLDAAAQASPGMAVGRDDRDLAFLPLSHIFERLVHLYFLTHGVRIYYSDARYLAEDMKVVRPTVLASVPRIYERIYAGVQAQATTPLRRRLFRSASRVAVRRGEALTGGRPESPGQRCAAVLYDRLVYARIREALGGRLRYVISGGAALSPELGRFFLGAGIPVCEGYGLTETSPVIAVNRPDDIRFGTVGRPLPGVEVRLAEDGEILCRGPNVMQGYWGRPEETAAALAGGWFHTGDIGAWDGEGRLAVVDRKKAILVLSTGKKVVPAPIEQRLAASPLIEAAMLVGDGRKYLAALLVPDFQEVDRLARQLGLTRSGADALAVPAVRAAIDAEVRRLTAPLADFERPKRWAVLPRALSEEAGELTPSLKIKLRVVLDHFAADVAALYAETSPGDRPAGPV